MNRQTQPRPPGIEVRRVIKPPTAILCNRVYGGIRMTDENGRRSVSVNFRGYSKFAQRKKKLKSSVSPERNRNNSF